MDFAVSWTDGLAVVTARTEIDITNAGLLRAALLSVLEKPPVVIVVDMADTDFCDSTGLNVLVRVQKQAGSAGHRAAAGDPGRRGAANAGRDRGRRAVPRYDTPGRAALQPD